MSERRSEAVQRPCASCGATPTYTITLDGQPTQACLRHLNHWRTPEVKLTGYFTRPELWALDEACKPLRETFPDYGPYLVGSVMERPTYRDVDVRLILKDERYDRLDDAEWGLLGFIVSRHLAAVTGLPVDFQFQRQSDANAAYGGKPRNPLGVRGFEHHWIGDQRLTPPAQADGEASA